MEDMRCPKYGHKNMMNMCPMMMWPINIGSMNMGPMQMKSPHMDSMNMWPMMMDTKGMDMDELEEDEKDEQYFMGMHPDNCSKMMPYVVEVLDNMEMKGDMLYEGRPDKGMVEGMVDTAYKNMTADMPDMADDKEEEDKRQYGRRRFGRDLVAVLLLNELLRRRRRRRYHDHYDEDNYYGGQGYNHPGFYYEDYYDNY